MPFHLIWGKTSTWSNTSLQRLFSVDIFPIRVKPSLLARKLVFQTRSNRWDSRFAENVSIFGVEVYQGILLTAGAHCNAPWSIIILLFVNLQSLLFLTASSPYLLVRLHFGCSQLCSVCKTSEVCAPAVGHSPIWSNTNLLSSSPIHLQSLHSIELHCVDWCH